MATMQESETESIQIYIEKPTTPTGNFNILRSTREISGEAEEVYRDLLLGDLQGSFVRGRSRWEKRFSSEKVLAVIEGMMYKKDKRKELEMRSMFPS